LRRITVATVGMKRTARDEGDEHHRRVADRADEDDEDEPRQGIEELQGPEDSRPEEAGRVAGIAPARRAQNDRRWPPP
jgi:hypothetical protein